MASSMTGCGQAVRSQDGRTCRVEVRSVNNRFLKVSVRSPESLVGLDQRIERLVQEHLRRGSVNVSVGLMGASEGVSRRLDQEQLAAYLDDLRDFCSTHSLPGPGAVDALLALPGAVVEVAGQEGSARHWPLVEETLEAALGQLDRMRCTEGAAMAEDLGRTCDEIAGLVSGIRARIPAAVESQRRRLGERVSRLLADQAAALQPADLAREVAILADRSDVAEEIVRLESHLAQFRGLLPQTSSGRQLEFLSQELGREANTIASKAADVAIAHAVVEIKSRLERLRELVQNLE
jgi:uncharacterized protein (TIGR00255 family)